MENNLSLYGITPKTKTINIVFQNGGVGDHVASLTAVDYIYRKYPWISIINYVPDFMKDLSINLLPEGAVVWAYSEMPGRYEPNRTTKSTKWDGHTSSMKIQTVDYAFLRLLDELPPITEKNYLKLKRHLIDTTRFILPFRYVVVTTGFTADTKEFRAEFVNQVVDYIKQRNYEVVFLGSEKTETGVKESIASNFNTGVDYSKGLNLVNQTSLIEAAAIMNDAKAVVGVDNGLFHVAGTTEVPIVAGYTFVSPTTTAPIRHNEIGWNVFPVLPDESLECKFCQENTNFLYGHDYRRCWFKGVKGFEAKVNLCTKQMIPDKFIAHLEKLL